MTAREFLQTAERLGVEVLTADGKVGLRGPVEALEVLRHELPDLKPALLAILLDGRPTEWPTDLPPWTPKAGCLCPLCSPSTWGHASQGAALRDVVPELFAKKGTLR